MKIVGTALFSSKQFTKRGKHEYVRFKPLVPFVVLDIQWIRYNKKQNHDAMCVIAYNGNEWCVYEYLHMDVKDLYIKAATCNWKKHINNTIDLTPNRVIIDREIYSIDPEGCRDIDDALHFCSFDNYIEIGIHIADVSSYVEHDSPYDKELQKRCESLYFGNNVINMMDQLTSTISLTEFAPKRAFSVIIKFDRYNEDYTVEFVKSIITVTNLTYDQAQNMIDVDTSDISDVSTSNVLKGLYMFGRQINKRFQIEDSPIYTTHEMVQNYMIVANYLVAQHLKQHSSIVPVRNHLTDTNLTNGNFTNGNFTNGNLTNGNLINDNLTNGNKYAQMAKMLEVSAEYSTVNVGHAGIGLDIYTHFTSPIRRYFDIYVHRCLYATLSNTDPPNLINLENLNQMNKFNKKCTTSYNDIEFIQNNNDEFIQNNDYKAIVIKITNDSVYVYINHIICIDLIGKRLKDSVNMEELKSKLQLYQTITVRMCIADNRVKYQIVDPIIFELDPDPAQC